MSNTYFPDFPIEKAASLLYNKCGVLTELIDSPEHTVECVRAQAHEIESTLLAFKEMEILDEVFTANKELLPFLISFKPFADIIRG